MNAALSDDSLAGFADARAQHRGKRLVVKI